MNFDIQFKINNDLNIKKYLRENSYWYKILNRHPERFNDLVEFMKERYKLRTTDKINSIIDKIGLVRTFFNVLR